VVSDPDIVIVPRPAGGAVLAIYSDGLVETLDGDKGDGRNFTRFYRTGGEIREYGKGSRAIEPRDVMESTGHPG
jgi:hypothetical protein